MNSSKRFPVLLFLLFLTFQLTAQIGSEKRPLSEVLSILQSRYDYQFSYANDVVESISIVTPPLELTIEEVVDYLRRNTSLRFKFLANNFIAIQSINTTNFICGYVIDNELKEPLEGATIISSIGGTSTNSFGYFELETTNPNESISISYVGFRSLAKNADDFDQDNCSYFYLTPKLEPLAEILISSYLVKGIDKVASGNFEINFSKFDIVPGFIETDVLQTIQALPGIQSVNETISNINIRGGTNDQNLILWDGVKMYQSGHFFGLISMFNPRMTSEVSVTKNGSDVSLTNGVSGTIAMKTDSKVSTAFEGSIGLNFTNLDGFLDVPLSKKASLQITGRKGIDDFISSTPTYTNYFERITQDTEVAAIAENERSFDFYDTSVRLNYQLTDTDFFRLNFLNVNNELAFTETGIVNQQEQNRESSLKQNTIAGGLFYERKWNSSFHTSLQVYETDYELEAFNADIGQQQRLLQENKVSETSILLNTLYKHSQQLSFTNGYQFIETGVTNLTDVDDPRIVDLRTRVLREHALFSQLNYRSDSKKLSVKAGVRYNYISDFQKHLVEPRLVVNYSIFEDFNLEIAGELKHQTTSQIINFQNDFLGIEKRRWRLSNDDNVPIIKSQQVSLGMSFAKNGWLINIEGYYKKVDGITSQSQGFLDDHIFDQTIGEYAIYGSDVLVNKKLGKFSSWLSYSYGTNEYTFNDFPEITFPNNVDIRHAVSFGTSYSSDRLKIAAGFNWHSGLPITTPQAGNELNGATINYNPSNSNRLEEYFRADASVMYNFRISGTVRAHAGISVWNFLDTENIISQFYRVNGDMVEEVRQNALGITPNAVLRISF